VSWRLPPPIWLASRRQTLLGALLQLGAMAWRLVKWCVAAGFALALLNQFTAATDSLWSAAGWLVAGALLVFLWERYGIADVAFGAGRRQRLLAVATLLALALAGTWVVAHVAGALALAVLAPPA
jgi:hypothetical protein